MHVDSCYIQHPDLKQVVCAVRLYALRFTLWSWEISYIHIFPISGWWYLFLENIVRKQKQNLIVMHNCECMVHAFFMVVA